MAHIWSIAMGPLRARRRNEIDDTLTVKPSLFSLRPALLGICFAKASINMKARFTFARDVLLLFFLIQFPKPVYSNAATLSHARIHLRSLLHTPLESFKVLPWVFANSRWQNGARPFQCVSSSVEGTHLSSALYWFKSIWANLINTTVLVLHVSVSQRTACTRVCVCDELRPQSDIHTLEAISLMCSPKPWCVQPFISPHHLSAALISRSLNGTKLAGDKSQLHEEYEVGGTIGCTHTRLWMTVSIYMCWACVKTLWYVLQIVAGTIDACIFNCSARMRVGGRSPWTEAEAKLNCAALSLHLFPHWSAPSLPLLFSLH